MNDMCHSFQLLLLINIYYNKLKEQYISVSGVRYKCELTSTESGTETWCNYTMLRSYAFKNNVLYDTDLYFVETELLSLYINKKLSTKDESGNSGNEDLTSGLLFPAATANSDTVTIDIRQFNQDMSSQYFDDECGGTPDGFLTSPLIYKLYKKTANTSSSATFEETSVLCNKLRIYTPHTSKNQNIVIHCYTYINNVKVHVLCRDISWYRRQDNFSDYCGTDGEKTKNHGFYTEYIDVQIPDLDYLFSNNIYYKENLNAGSVSCFDMTTEEGKKMYERYKNCVSGQYTALSVYELPFSIVKKEDITDADITDADINGTDDLKEWVAESEDAIEAAVYVKTYIPDLMHTTRQVQQKHALTVRFIPYDSSYKYKYNIGTKYWYNKEVLGFGQNKCLVLSDRLPAQSTQFFTDSRIKLKSRIGFNDDGTVSVINIFDYPLKEDKTMFPDFNVAYEYFNGVDLSQYTGIIDDEDEDGWWDPDYCESMQCGASLEIFADKFYKDRLYKESYGFKQQDGHLVVEDFAFSLKGLFASWDQWPGVTFVRCTFTDKYIGKKIIGNVCTLVKEQFKFLINDDVKNGAAQTTGTSLIKTEHPEWYPSDINDILVEENVMDKSRFNFLNNIKVNVIVPTAAPTVNTTNANTIASTSSGVSKIIYKPVFYKVHDVNSIKLKSGLVQNIGVNLMDWMTKVETFKIVINTVMITEYARNDNYVIFNINTDSIVSATGTDTYSGEYHVLNQDSEYITSGSWSVS